jgi:hypothetical protein
MKESVVKLKNPFCNLVQYIKINLFIIYIPSSVVTWKNKFQIFKFQWLSDLFWFLAENHDILKIINWIWHE